MLNSLALGTLHVTLAAAFLLFGGCTSGSVAGTERVDLSPMLGQGDRWSHTFQEEGIYNIRCRPHPEMIQLVRVGPAGTQPESHEAEMTGLQFQPRELNINVGDEITWINNDSLQHDVDVRLVIE
jgi:plastocyanin